MPDLSGKNFLEFYDQYVEKIYRYVFFRIGSPEQARDLTSEVFLKSWEYVNKNKKSHVSRPAGKIKNQNLSEFNEKDANHAESFHKIDNPRAFLYQVARNLLADFYRKKERTPLSLDEISIGVKASGLPEPESLADLVDREIEMETVRRALSSLSADYQEVIIWRYLDEMEIKEIAEILDRTENAVRVLLSRALSDLRLTLRQRN